MLIFGMLILAFALAFARMLKGPEMSDRIAAMELISSVTMAFVLSYSILVNKAIYFDIVIVISLISFIGTVAVSTYLKQKK
ncbi:multisubunit sodium/proton antiporter, MrpF subunit [Bacteroidales bacterium 6E]|nr:multisubunit sodium/proton antiporter, MrpF subunit [Bacteroidales bacterium 6E]